MAGPLGGVMVVGTWEGEEEGEKVMAERVQAAEALARRSEKGLLQRPLAHDYGLGWLLAGAGPGSWAPGGPERHRASTRRDAP